MKSNRLVLSIFGKKCVVANDTWHCFRVESEAKMIALNFLEFDKKGFLSFLWFETLLQLHSQRPGAKRGKINVLRKLQKLTFQTAARISHSSSLQNHDWQYFTTIMMVLCMNNWYHYKTFNFILSHHILWYVDCRVRCKT